MLCRICVFISQLLQDIEFAFLCEESGLAVVKCGRFFHHKRDLQDKQVSKDQDSDDNRSLPELWDMVVRDHPDSAILVCIVS